LKGHRVGAASGGGVGCIIMPHEDDGHARTDRSEQRNPCGGTTVKLKIDTDCYKIR
jgi:hypothetical protein